MTQNNFDFNLALQLVESNKQFPINFDQAWPWLDYSRKDVAKRHFEKCGFVENVDFSQVRQSVELPQGGNTYKEIIKMTVECFKTWAMMSGTQKGKEVRKYFLECEKIAKDKLAQAITKEVSAVDKIKQFGAIMDTIFHNINNVPKEIIAGRVLNYAKECVPALAPELEKQRDLLINSTAINQEEGELLTVTELGKLLTPPLSAVKTNQLLISKGYQTKNSNKKGQKDLTYKATPLGEEYSQIVFATGKDKNDTYQQLRWHKSLASLL